MLKRSLTVSHHRQRQPADCLAACAAMVLDYYSHPYTYSQLLSLLDVRSFGAPAPNVQRLVELGVSIVYKPGSLEELEQQIALPELGEHTNGYQAHSPG